MSAWKSATTSQSSCFFGPCPAQLWSLSRRGYCSLLKSFSPDPLCYSHWALCLCCRGQMFAVLYSIDRPLQLRKAWSLFHNVFISRLNNCGLSRLCLWNMQNIWAEKIQTVAGFTIVIAQSLFFHFVLWKLKELAHSVSMCIVNDCCWISASFLSLSVSVFLFLLVSFPHLLLTLRIWLHYLDDDIWSGGLWNYSWWHQTLFFFQFRPHWQIRWVRWNALEGLLWNARWGSHDRDIAVAV